MYNHESFHISFVPLKDEDMHLKPIVTFLMSLPETKTPSKKETTQLVCRNKMCNDSSSQLILLTCLQLLTS